MLANKLLICCFILLMWSCTKSPKIEDISIPNDGFHELLSDYHLFTVEDGHLYPRDEVKYYEVTNELFTDYARKQRYVYVPAGPIISKDENDKFIYPDGTVFIKNFAYDEGQLDQYRNIEIRLLIKHNQAWRAMSYMWNETQTDATMSELGEIIPLEIYHEAQQLSFDYIIPNKNQCKSCHNYNEKIDPLGFKASNLHKVVTLNDTSYHQINHLNSVKILSDDHYNQAMVSYLDATQPIDKRAKAYLDVNCGHCHREQGPGNTSGLFLQYNETRSNHLGLCKGPVAAGKGSGGRKYDIAPGLPDSSILHFRMNSDDPGIMMPEIGRSLIHKEGVELIASWISSMEDSCE